jgi:hypothetical protein
MPAHGQDAEQSAVPASAGRVWFLEDLAKAVRDPRGTRMKLANALAVQNTPAGV